jgi:hypothetical protein
MQRLAKPVMRMDGMQRIATMMAMLIPSGVQLQGLGAQSAHRPADKQEGSLEERITETCMEVLIRNEWINLAEAKGGIVIAYGITATTKGGYQEVTRD